MSAFIVNHAHIDALLTFANCSHMRFTFYPPMVQITCQYSASEVDALTALGQILVDENTRSVNQRYNENKNPSRYTFRFHRPVLSPVAILKACQCFDYQACETEDYAQTQAASIVDNIRAAAIRALPGYESAQWEIGELPKPAAPKPAAFELAAQSSGPRAISAIAADIRHAWPKPYFGAVPYLAAMRDLQTIGDKYGEDDARSIVLYFLSNAATFRGDKARTLKAELKAIAKR